MAQNLAVNDIIKAQLWTSDSEQASVNTFHYRVNSITGSIPTLSDFLEQWLTAGAATYRACLCASAHFDGGLAQIIKPLPLFTAIKSLTGQGNGAVVEPAMSRQTAGLLSWKTPLAGPGGRGRTYIPFPGTASSSGLGIPTNGYVSDILAFAVAISAFDTVTVTGGTATVKIGIQQSKTGNFVEYNDVVANQKWATQKRRGSYGRPNFSPV